MRALFRHHLSVAPPAKLPTFITNTNLLRNHWNHNKINLSFFAPLHFWIVSRLILYYSCGNGMRRADKKASTEWKNQSELQFSAMQIRAHGKHTKRQVQHTLRLMRMRIVWIRACVWEFFFFFFYFSIYSDQKRWIRSFAIYCLLRLRKHIANHKLITQWFRL